ncbi:MAG: response regulator transcription factor [Mycolicibacter algericus]|uniref:Transcriptional regulatory protein n=4 Tax=Mycobacteriaceae TaxID=1762 RepID=F5Z2Z5_MYCSD|nr:MULTISPECIES: response regulator transcription factor [Mycobacteriaceae]AEF37110.1 transcriptional regulatory protein [Mycolicibacter sinensis]OQZ99690.1 transcriptional regulator [Mycolicibacter algericus DSM 45454]BBX13875.1 transcriptional regulator [Mycobacterium novum]GFG86191.1 transcriptional regulator [Mycolicibacter algericus]
MEILLLTDRDEFEQTLSALRVFGHSVGRAPLAVTRADCRGAAAVLVDGCTELATARETCRRLCAWAPSAAVLAVVAAEDFVAVDIDWQVDDVLVTTAGPAEAHARLRLALARRRESEQSAVQFGDLIIHPDSYSVSLSGRELDLTLTEFKLLNYLVRHAGHAFTRTRLLHEVWGGEGSRRKVDVHVQRLRAKLGADHESIVDTVRGVGYMTPESPQPQWAIAN